MSHQQIFRWTLRRRCNSSNQCFKTTGRARPGAAVVYLDHMVFASGLR